MPRPATSPEPAHESPNLLTKEREEYNAEISEKRAEQLAYLESQKGLRQLKLQQFQHDGTEDA